MAISYSFIDNEVYGTDDVNSITKDLTGAGVAPFPSKDSYSTSDLNSMTSAVVGSGVSLDGCKCTKTGNAVDIGEGIIYFENGVRLTVDGSGYTVSVPMSTKGYIFAKFSIALQTADIVFAEALPESGYLTVLLAEISTDGTLTDVRTFARSKAATFGANATFETTFTYGSAVYDEELGMYEYGSIDNVDLSKFNYALISYNMTGGSRETKFYGTFNLSENTLEGVILGTSSTGYNQTKLLDYSNGVDYHIMKVNNRLILYIDGEPKYAAKLGIKVKLV